MSFATAVQQLLPFLPAPLAQIYADAWIDSGDQTIALAVLNADPALDTYFPGIRRPNGSLRMSIVEYIGTVAGYEDALLGVGVNPSVFASQMGDLIAGNVSVNEFRARVDAVEARIISQQDELKTAYASLYGLTLDTAALVASVLDPDVGQQIIDRKIGLAEVSGEAALAGFSINRDTAIRLQQFGVDRGRARELFQTAAEAVPRFDMAARRQGEGPVGLQSIIAADVEGNAGEQRRLRRVLAGETADFTERNLVEVDEVGGLKGLRAR